MADGLRVEDILKHWEALKPVIMEQWNEPDKEPLVELFGNVRDQWMAEDLEGWIRANRSQLSLTADRSCRRAFHFRPHCNSILAGSILGLRTLSSSLPLNCTLLQLSRQLTTHT